MLWLLQVLVERAGQMPPAAFEPRTLLSILCPLAAMRCDVPQVRAQRPKAVRMCNHDVHAVPLGGHALRRATGEGAAT